MAGKHAAGVDRECMNLESRIPADRIRVVGAKLGIDREQFAPVLGRFVNWHTVTATEKICPHRRELIHGAGVTARTLQIIFPCPGGNCLCFGREEQGHETHE